MQHLVDVKPKIYYTGIQADYYQARPISSGIVCKQCSRRFYNEKSYRHNSLHGLTFGSWKWSRQLRALEADKIKPVLCPVCYGLLPSNNERQVIS